jgi:hypothetical protein
MLLLYHNNIKVLKDALAYLGPYQTLISLWYNNPGETKYFFTARHHKNLKILNTNRFCIVAPIVRSKCWHLYQLCYVKLFSTNYNRSLLLLDDPVRVRSKIATVVCQIQRFYFDCNLVRYFDCNLVVTINNTDTSGFGFKSSTDNRSRSPASTFLAL